MREGIVYIATGEQYINETRKSVRSLREHMPDISTSLITDEPVEIEGINKVIIKDDFDYDYRDSITDLEYIPYDRTVQLDSDTYICDDFSEVFSALDQFEFGACLNPWKTHMSSEDDTYVPENVPHAFPVFNSGVMAYKKSEPVRDLLENWRRIYDTTVNRNPKKLNQPALWEALYNSKVRLFPLPREYNCFILFPGCVNHDVKILHGRHPDLEKIAKMINKSNNMRCYNKSRYPIRISQADPPGDERIGYRLQKSLRQNGLGGTLDKIMNKIRNELIT